MNKDEEIYGYQIDLRALQSLKTDGSFMGSSGASISDYSYMSFEETTYSINAEAKYDAINENYYINNKTVTVDEINTYINDFKLKENLKFIKVK